MLTLTSASKSGPWPARERWRSVIVEIEEEQLVELQRRANELARRDQQITDARNAAVAADSKASEAAAKAALAEGQVPTTVVPLPPWPPRPVH